MVRSGRRRRAAWKEAGLEVKCHGAEIAARGGDGEPTERAQWAIPLFAGRFGLSERGLGFEEVLEFLTPFAGLFVGNVFLDVCEHAHG
ncbi:MAG: hypothetical protein RLZZ282_77 [Verrucomicrobiota bacterium]